MTAPQRQRRPLQVATRSWKCEDTFGVVLKLDVGLEESLTAEVANECYQDVKWVTSRRWFVYGDGDDGDSEGGGEAQRWGSFKAPSSRSSNKIFKAINDLWAPRESEANSTCGGGLPCQSYLVFCTLYYVRCILLPVHCILFVVFCTLYSVPCAMCALYSVPRTLYFVLCSLY